MIKNMKKNVDVEVCYITRTYMTRHGAGRFDTECSRDLISDHIKEDETNKTHPFQGELRYGVLDWRSTEDRVSQDFKRYSDQNWKLSFFFTHENECRLPGNFNKYNYNTYVSDGFTRENVRILQE